MYSQSTLGSTQPGERPAITCSGDYHQHGKTPPRCTEATAIALCTIPDIMLMQSVKNSSCSNVIQTWCLVLLVGWLVGVEFNAPLDT